MPRTPGVPSAQVLDHLMDELAREKDAQADDDAILARAVEAYRIDRSDDPLQVANIEQLRSQRDQRDQRIREILDDIRRVRAGQGLVDRPVNGDGLRVEQGNKQASNPGTGLRPNEASAGALP
jgi:hypothetical protein